jgi:hypothetical protein
VARATRRSTAGGARALALALLVACAHAPPPEPPPAATPEAIRAAAQTILEISARPEARLELFEGGFTVDAWRWQVEERVVWDEPSVPGGARPDILRGPRVVKERRLVGPARTSMRFADLEAASLHRSLFETDVVLRVAGEADPIVVDVGDEETARRLAEALDVLIRGREAPP